MTMDFQGKKVTHDFLSLYSSNSSYQNQDPTPTHPPSQGVFLKTHDFLRPMDRPEKGGAASFGGGASSPVGHVTVDVERSVSPVERHVLPGGIGTYSISHVAGADWAARPVKVERSTCGVVSGFGLESKPEPDYDVRNVAGRVQYNVWEDKDNNINTAHWSSPPFISAPTAARRKFMDSAAAPSKSSRGFGEDDEEDDEFGKREGSSSRKDLAIKVEGKESGSEQRPNTPRSKHSATEQRRRSKINDRFQILQELIPHNHQKRDKASFLLEVIEYIRFLQEKVQKFESSCPEWSQDSSKVMPWVKVYFRSFWKNAQNNGHAAGDGFADPSHVMKNGSVPSAYVCSGSPIPVAPALFSGARAMETDVSASAPYKVVDAATGFASADKITSQDQSHWSRPSGPVDCTVSSEAVNEHEELTIDEGTISVSAAYSQGVLTAITQSLQSTGVDLSQASISVQINLGKRPLSRRHAATTTTFTPMEHEDATAAREAAGDSRVISAGKESSQAAKRNRTR